MKKITYCKKPAIKEAFCLIQGKPAELNKTDAPSLEKQADKHFKSIGQKLENVPTFIMIPEVSGQLMNPFWVAQKKWNNGSNIARYGHRYLSVHRLCSTESQYETYEKSIRQDIIKWIDLYRDVLATEEDPHSIDLISYGYINELDLPFEDFSLNKYVGLLYQLQLDSNTADTLNRMSFAFDLSCSETNIKTAIKVKAQPNLDNSKMKLNIEIYSSFNSLDGIDFLSNHIMDYVDRLKNHAKDTFFSFVTDHVKNDIMEAE